MAQALGRLRRQLMRQMQRWLQGRQRIVLGDASDAAIEQLALAPQFTGIAGLRLDAAQYAPAPLIPQRFPGGGRLRKKGQQLLSLTRRPTDPRTLWQPLTVRHWNGELTTRTIEVAVGTTV